MMDFPGAYFRCNAGAHYRNDFTAEELICGECPLCGGPVIDTRTGEPVVHTADEAKGGKA